jgi:hypothetical protein
MRKIKYSLLIAEIVAYHILLFKIIFNYLFITFLSRIIDVQKK